MTEAQQRLYVLACIRDLKDAPPGVCLDAARLLIAEGDYSAETLEMLFDESERVLSAGPLLTR